MTFVAPPLPPYMTDPGNMQVWWQLVVLRIGETLDGQQQQIDIITAMLDDNTLTPDKKPVWIFIYSFLTGEQAGIDAEATTYGITTEKTNYDTAISTLATYLGTLATPVLWSDLTGNTAIVGTTFRSNFNAVLVAKQALLNKMHDTSKVLANTAQTTANTAQTTANTGVTNAAVAQVTANTVTRNDKITGSSVVPANCLSASDAGSNATITIAAHTRIYGDGSQISVAGGSVTGLAYSTTYGVYYDDSTASATTPTYHATSTPSNALPSFIAGRHFVGTVQTPASGAAATSGGSSPPGTGGVDRSDFSTL